MESKMYIEQFTVKNFRSIKEETFYLHDCTVLIGKNNCGKTNVLDSLRFLFEATNKDFTETDLRDKGKAIEIEAIISGVEPFLILSDEKHRSKIEKCVKGGKIRIRKGNNTSGKMQIFEPDKDSFGTPTGIDQAFKQFLPELMTIHSLADVKDEVKGKSTDTIGKILKLIGNEIEDKIGPELNKAFTRVHQLVNIADDGDNRIQEIKEIEAFITEFLSDLYKNVRTRLTINFPSAMDIFQNVAIELFDGVWTPYFRKGQGLQRSLYLSLFRTYAELTRKQTSQTIKRPLFLIFEEPEAFLHPQLQEEMQKLIEQIATKHQILLSTHSPFMISPKNLNNIIRIHKKEIDDTGNWETKVCGQKLDSDDFRRDNQLITFLNLERSSRIFFSDNVLLVEGISDRYLFRAMSEKLGFGSLEENDFEIVECGTKDNLLPFKKVIGKMGINTKIITDLDFLLRGAGEFCSDQSDQDLNDTISKIGQELEQRVSSIVNDNPDKQKSERKKAKLEILSLEKDETITPLKRKAIEEFKQYSLYVLSKGQIEQYAGIGEHSKSAFLKAAQEILDGTMEIKFENEIRAIFENIFNH